MASVNPAPRRPSRVRRVATVLAAAGLAALIVIAAMITLSADEARRLCDAAVADGVAAAAAARSAVTDADAALHAERRRAAAERDGEQGTRLVLGVRAERERVREAAWVPRCTTREDVEIVRSQSHTAHRSTAALERALVALRAAHPHGSR